MTEANEEYSLPAGDAAHDGNANAGDESRPAAQRGRGSTWRTPSRRRRGDAQAEAAPGGETGQPAEQAVPEGADSPAPAAKPARSPRGRKPAAATGAPD